MTPPATAMHASLSRTYGCRLIADPRWQLLADLGLAYARQAYTAGTRGADLIRHTATHMADACWEASTNEPKSSRVQGAQELERHWIPAADALIAAAMRKAVGK